MTYRIFSTSESAWGGMLAAIRSARTSVYLEMYIFTDDREGSEFFKVLETAAGKGVNVVAILDVVGSWDMLSGAVSRLRAAGADVVFASFFWQRLHRKTLIVDQGTARARAFIGGVNIGKAYARWRDLLVEVQGPVVETIVRSFARVYRRCGGKGAMSHVAAETKANVGAVKKAQAWFIDHGIGARRHEFRKYYEERLTHAKKSIVMVTPYFFPPRWLIARLHQAIIRGVKVEILLPKATDHRLVDSTNRSFAAVMTELGAACYFTGNDGKDMNHAKAMLVDGREGIIGSQNLDPFSFNLNIEAGVFFNDPAMVADLARIIDGWKAEALPAYRKRAKFKWYDLPAAFFLRVAGLVPMG